MRWTPLTRRGQPEYAAGQFYNALDFGLRERIEARHAAIFLRKDYTRGDDADRRVCSRPGSPALAIPAFWAAWIAAVEIS